MKICIDNKVENRELTIDVDFELVMLSDLTVTFMCTPSVYSYFNILNDIIPTFDGCDCTVVIYQSKDRQSGFVLSGTTFRLVNVSDEKRRLYISGDELRWM